MITKEQFTQAVKLIYAYQLQLATEFASVAGTIRMLESDKAQIALTPEATWKKKQVIRSSDISIRLLNVLGSNSEFLGIDIYKTPIAELEKIPIKKFLRCRGFGFRCKKELIALMLSIGIELKNN